MCVSQVVLPLFRRFPRHAPRKIPATDKVAHMNIYVGEIDAATITVTANYTHTRAHRTWLTHTRTQGTHTHTDIEPQKQLRAANLRHFGSKVFASAPINY